MAGLFLKKLVLVLGTLAVSGTGAHRDTVSTAAALRRPDVREVGFSARASNGVAAGLSGVCVAGLFARRVGLVEQAALCAPAAVQGVSRHLAANGNWRVAEGRR